MTFDAEQSVQDCSASSVTHTEMAYEPLLRPTIKKWQKCGWSYVGHATSVTRWHLITFTVTTAAGDPKPRTPDDDEIGADDCCGCAVM